MSRIAISLGVRVVAAATLLAVAMDCRADDPDNPPEPAPSVLETVASAEIEPDASELLQPASFQVQGDPSAHGYVYLDSSGQLPPEPKPLPSGAERSILLSNVDDESQAPNTQATVERTASATVSKEEELVARAVQLAKKADTIGEFTRVIGYCQKATKMRSNRAPTRFVVQLAAWAANRRGEVAVAEGDETVALASFRQAIDIDGRCWQAVHNRGVSLAIGGDRAKALSDFTRAIDLNPDFAPAYRNRGELRIALGLTDAAIEDYSKAIELAPDDAELYRIRGHAEHRRGRFVAAVQDFNEAIKNNPRNAPAYTDRGNVYAELGYYRQALKDFRQALRADERYPWAYRSVAWVLATCPDPQYRRPEKALVAAQRAIALAKAVDPLDFDVMAAAQASAGQFPAAVITEERALQSVGTAPLAAEFRARLALYQNRKNFISSPRSSRRSEVRSPSWADAPPTGAVTAGAQTRIEPDVLRSKKPGATGKETPRTQPDSRFQGLRSKPLSSRRPHPNGGRNAGKLE